MYGFKSANGLIQDIGRAPITVRDIDATVTLAATPALTATALDEQGYAAARLQPRLTAGKAIITLPRNSLYTIITR
jgi:hypothetical protein